MNDEILSKQQIKLRELQKNAFKQKGAADEEERATNSNATEVFVWGSDTCGQLGLEG